MDRKKEAKKFDWLPAAMPGVARLVAEKRAALGDAHVRRCWAKGMAGEPGWFFAREGGIALGTPWEGDAVMANWAAAQISASQALLLIREKSNGA